MYAWRWQFWGIRCFRHEPCVTFSYTTFVRRNFLSDKQRITLERLAETKAGLHVGYLLLLFDFNHDRVCWQILIKFSSVVCNENPLNRSAVVTCRDRYGKVMGVFWNLLLRTCQKLVNTKEINTYYSFSVCNEKSVFLSIWYYKETVNRILKIIWL
jgi:hypothetical protein